jgi:rod shape determining protein RodA
MNRRRLVTLLGLALAVVGILCVGLDVVSIAERTHPWLHGTTQRQLGWALAGGVSAVLLMLCPAHWLRAAAYPAAFAALVGGIVSIAWGRGWSRPASLLLIGLVLALSRFALERGDRPRRASDYAIPLVIVGAFVLIGSRLHLSYGLLWLVVAVAALSTLRWPGAAKAIAVGGAVAALPLLWSLLHAYQRARFLCWIRPESDPYGCGYALLTQRAAISAGGLGGAGAPWSSSHPLPDAVMVSPLVIWTHQRGALGAIALLLLFSVVIGIAAYLTWTIRAPFFRALAAGVGAFWFASVVLSAGASFGLLPQLTIPLPLVSYGGGALVASLASVGLLAHIALYLPRSERSGDVESRTRS